MSKEIYYKVIDKNIYRVKTAHMWFISADNEKDALGLANKRGEYKADDIEYVGSCSTIFGTSSNYEDVINMPDKLANI